jgi:tetratricopeptide (TPR) repeat protein
MRLPLGFFCPLLCVKLIAFTQATLPDYDHTLHEARELCDHGQCEQAVSLLEDAVSSRSKENQRNREAEMLAFLGSLYERNGKYEQAENALNRSIYCWTKLEGPGTHHLVEPLTALGELYYKAGQASLAQRVLERALAIEQGSGAHADAEATLRTVLGNVYFLQHKTALAQQNAEEALKYAALGDNSRPEGGAAYTLLGAIYFESGEIGKAESCLQQALAIWQSKRGEQGLYVAEGVANLAVFYAGSGQREKAEPLFPKAKKMLEATGGKASFFLRNFLAEYAGFERKSGHKKKPNSFRNRSRLCGPPAPKTRYPGTLSMRAH